MVIRSDLRQEHYLPRDRFSGLIASEQDYRHCRQVMIAASKNYTFAGRLLPSEVRPHVEALYAFLRVGDDRVDVAHDGIASPRHAIEDWERKYRRAFAVGGSSDPVMRAYIDTAHRFGIPEGIMDPYFWAMKNDLSTNRFASFADLLEYVAGSAVPVGRAMTYIMGVRQPYTLAQALPRADDLAIAMQLSNFLRDVAEDWARGRVYIPQEDLQLFGVTEAQLASGQMSPNLQRLMQFEVERAHNYYRKARPGVAMLARGRWAVMSGLSIYRAILAALARQGYDPFAGRAGASDLRKAGLVARAWWASCAW